MKAFAAPGVSEPLQFVLQKCSSGASRQAHARRRKGGRRISPSVSNPTQSATNLILASDSDLQAGASPRLSVARKTHKDVHSPKCKGLRGRTGCKHKGDCGAPWEWPAVAQLVRLLQTWKLGFAPPPCGFWRLRGQLRLAAATPCRSLRSRQRTRTGGSFHEYAYQGCHRL
jgi:hypothetical protein